MSRLRSFERVTTRLKQTHSSAGILDSHCETMGFEHLETNRTRRPSRAWMCKRACTQLSQQRICAYSILNAASGHNPLFIQFSVLPQARDLVKFHRP